MGQPKAAAAPGFATGMLRRARTATRPACYFAASAGGTPLAIIKQYVVQQRQRASSSPLYRGEEAR